MSRVNTQGLISLQDFQEARCNWVPKNKRKGEYLFEQIQNIVGMTNAIKICTPEKGDQAWDMSEAGKTSYEIAIWLGWEDKSPCKFVPYEPYGIYSTFCKTCGFVKTMHS